MNREGIKVAVENGAGAGNLKWKMGGKDAGKNGFLTRVEAVMDVRIMKSLLLLTAILSLAGVARAAEKPNIIFILADDIGYGDLGCYGAKVVKTPHCDRLAREGVRFSDAHATGSTCTPTRYAFIIP